jgi:diadenylate cyclase
MSPISLIIAIKITLTCFLVYRTERLVRMHRSWGLGLFFLTLIIALSIAMIKTGPDDALHRAITLLLFILFVVTAFESELALLAGLFNKKFEKDPGNGKEKEMLGEIARAAVQMAETKTGALIAFEQNDSLLKLAQSGIPINADIKKDLLTTLFVKDTPTHDGCALIRNGRLTHCGVVLPLTSKVTVEEGLGTRHRAALGLSERTDAVLLVVSEEEGSISIAKEGNLMRRIPPETLEKELQLVLKPKKEKRLYPLHYLEYFSVKQYTYNLMAFSKSFGQHFYETLVTVFFLLTYIFLNPDGFPKSSDLIFEQPWAYLPVCLFVINLFFVVSNCELTLNSETRSIEKKWRVLSLALFKKTMPLGDIRQVILRRESSKRKKWALALDGSKNRPILIDSGSSYETLEKTAREIRDLLRLEWVG